MPGRVDPARGVVSSAVNLGITAPAPIGDLVRARLGVPVHVENDVNAAALGDVRPPRAGAGAVAGLRQRRHRHRRRVRARRAGCGAARPAAPARSATCRCRPTARRAGAGRSAAPRRSAPGGPSPTTRPARRRRRGDGVGGTTVRHDGRCRRRRRRRRDDPAGRRCSCRRSLAALVRREQTSPMLADIGLAGRVVLAPADVPLGSLGAVLAAREACPSGSARSGRSEDDRRGGVRSSRRTVVVAGRST